MKGQERDGVESGNLRGRVLDGSINRSDRAPPSIDTPFSRSARFRVVLLGCSVGLMLVAAICFGPRLFRPHIEDRVYLIGFPPSQRIREDGSPAGLGVELVSQAARRRGIRLKWSRYPGGEDVALRSGAVDVWPLVTITPERRRRKAFHISKPYMQHDYHLLVLGTSAYFQVSDMRVASIGYRHPVHAEMLQRVLPEARLVPAGSRKHAAANVCSGLSDAAFFEEIAIGALLLKGISCSPHALWLIPMPMLRSQLGVGSTLEASAVATRSVAKSTPAPWKNCCPDS
jgi:hypothetical protein